MGKLQLTKRDMLLFEYLHCYKVATFKQIRRDVLRAGMSTAWERLNKLRLHGMIACKGSDHRGDKSLIFSLATNGHKHLLSTFPQKYLWHRYKSNSIEHDLRLLDIRMFLKQKKLVTEYWTENQLQTLQKVSDNDQLSLFRMFNFDALLKLDNGLGNRLFCGVEFESSIKARSDYIKKFSLVYGQQFLKAVLYICENENVERALRKVEQSMELQGEKKLFYIQYAKLRTGEKSVTFRNQENKIIVIA